MAVLGTGQPVTVQEYIDLRTAVGWGSPDPPTVARALDLTWAWAVERDEQDRLVGLARAVGDGVYLLLVDVMVRPDAQGRGTGRRLVESLLHQPRVSSARHTTLFAAPEVVGFYTSLGLEAQPGTYFHA